MNKKWFLCYREKDNAYFFFNGHWPVDVNPGGFNFWWIETPSADGRTSDTEKDILKLNEILNTKKKVFTMHGCRFTICQRGEFLPTNE